jgi:hypothetical protein
MPECGPNDGAAGQETLPILGALQSRKAAQLSIVEEP